MRSGGGYRKGKGRKHVLKKRLVYGAIAVAFILLCFLIYFSLHLSNQTAVNQTQQRKAAIVDHLSISQPNQTFVQTSTTILEKSGWTVDYYPGEDVTVGFYRNLPTHDYGLIVFRVHSALGSIHQSFLFLFTSEPYSAFGYWYEQATNQISDVFFLPYNEGDPKFFGISPEFVKSSMNGKFENTIIVMMGCDGLTHSDMAEAFVKKGAKVYVGWSGPVSARHTDQATTQLLKHLVTEEQTIMEAIGKTMEEVGTDPEYESSLEYYPASASNLTLTSYVAEIHAPKVTNCSSLKEKDSLNRLSRILRFPGSINFVEKEQNNN